jgi:hypothetical protein
VINPVDSYGNPTLPDGVTLTFAVNLTDLNTGLTGHASVDVSSSLRVFSAYLCLCSMLLKVYVTGMEISLILFLKNWVICDDLSMLPQGLRTM